MQQAHAMLVKHHEKTQELEYRQQKSVHQLREEQVSSGWRLITPHSLDLPGSPSQLR